MTEQLHAIISGRVQGVYFRQTTKEIAINMGVVGTVRNCDDGTVEVTAEAARATLDEFLNWLHMGPPGARVDGIKVEWSAATGKFERFRVIG